MERIPLIHGWFVVNTMDGKRVNSASLANAPFWPHSIVNGFDQFLANLSAGRATGSRPYDNKDAKKQDCPHLFYTDVVINGKAEGVLGAAAAQRGSVRLPSRLREIPLWRSLCPRITRPVPPPLQSFYGTSLQTPLLRQLDFRAQRSLLSTATWPSW